ncbi:hypothetical protein C923_04937 [Plasmodium falciparum UGT5.1]|uniref:Uncharacterized protein n=1 Tax=Plasmodium falciparum UGT5.1 TaxID=1237627 RepID=W7JHY6_PLAFA|nr:hypothetical protein C923_04937 [Plasmodium falciparum UGT5.1]
MIYEIFVDIYMYLKYKLLLICKRCLQKYITDKPLYSNNCYENFLFFISNIYIISFLIDFFFLLIKDEEVVSEDEIIVSTCLTILLCIVKIFLNLYSIYFCINVYGHIVESKERHIKETCASYMGKGLLLHYSVINCFSLVETYIESFLTLISIISFKAQVQSYQIII